MGIEFTRKTMTDAHNPMMTIAIATVVVLLLGYLTYNSYLGKDIRGFFTKRPLSTFTKNELEVAFMYAPELRTKYEMQGGMSSLEHRQAMRLSLKRIKNELARRKK